MNILNSLAGVFFVCIFFLFDIPVLAAQNRVPSLGISAGEGVQDTQKIKIISAFCIDGKWSFNIYDGVKDKTSMVVLGRRNADGIVVESFDESSQTAVVSTPRGRFRIAMQMSSAPKKDHEASVEVPPPPPPPPEEGTQGQQTPTTQKNMTRRELLNLIK